VKFLIVTVSEFNCYMWELSLLQICHKPQLQVPHGIELKTVVKNHAMWTWIRLIWDVPSAEAVCLATAILFRVMVRSK